jgi:menaquinone-dependent protoporphyrinogen oxidase
MKVLVAYASKHGSTKGIAEFIGEKLRQKGLDCDVLDVSDVKNPGAYDAFVIGSAVYMFHWMKQAKQFESRNRAVLSKRPVWLFSSGPTGSERNHAKGKDLLDPSVSGPAELDELKEGLQVRDHRVFFGAMDDGAGFFARFVPRSAKGDFRDWQEIESWANGIAKALEAPMDGTKVAPG